MRRILLCLLVALALSPTAAAGAAEQTITATAGQPFSGQVADIPSPCIGGVVSNEQATIVWGDDLSTAGVLAPDPQGTGFTVSGTHTYATVGTYAGSVNGSYRCGQATPSFTAKFTAQVAAPKQEPPPTETTPTAPIAPTPPPTPTPPPPPSPTPVVHASFAIASLTPGRAVLDATASTPPGTSATSYSWNITGDGHPDAVCKGSEPQLTVMTRGALDTTVSLTATDAQGAGTTAQATLDIPAPLLHASHAARASAVHTNTLSTHRAVGTPVSPAFTVLGECSGSSHPVLAPLSNAGARLVSSGRGLGVRPIGSIGAPPEECNQDVEFGAADVLGCLKPIEEPNELPGGITTTLAGLLCGANDHSFCTPP